MDKLCLLLILFAFAGCSVSIVKDSFDNSTVIKLEREINDFDKLSGTIELVKMVFTKEDKPNNKINPVKIFCKFEGNNKEVLDGKTIEVKVDDKIYLLKLLEARFDKNSQTSTSSVTIIDGFTTSDSEDTSIHYIAVESILSQEVIEAMKNAKSIMFRITTKNIDGVAKNTFKCASYTVNDIKKFINYITTQ